MYIRSGKPWFMFVVFSLFLSFGMLHDVGKIILASMFPKLYQGVTEIEYNSNSEFLALEKKIIGVNNKFGKSGKPDQWILHHERRPTGV